MSPVETVQPSPWSPTGHPKDSDCLANVGGSLGSHGVKSRVRTTEAVTLLIQVFDVWETQEAFDQFLTYLGPVMQELGIELAQPPTIMPIVDLVQQ